MLDRVSFLKAGAATASSVALGAPPPDHRITITRSAVELAPGRVIRTVTYNGAFPGPLLRLPASRPVTVELVNDTDVPEQFHWHGQRIPSAVDGAAEERTPYIPARGRRRVSFVPGPSGFRFYHTHLRAGDNLQRGQYTAQVGPVYVEPPNDPGAYDREVFLVLKEFEPSLSGRRHDHGFPRGRIRPGTANARRDRDAPIPVGRNAEGI